MKKQNPRKKSGLTVITTHINADFDALASMLAAQKLYPGSVVVFSGSQEKNLKNFFIDSMVYLFNMMDIKGIDLSSIERLVLVDTKQASRIGALAELAKDPRVEVHIYDHHPPAPGDIKGTAETFEPTGANVTILIQKLRKRRIPITPDEATVLCLGIYEDTGSFTFPSTTEKDLTIAAFLLSKGANIDTIASLISRELNPAQVSILNDLIQNAIRYNIEGIEVAITGISVDAYIPDFAFLVQKLLRMEDLSALFAVAMMGSKIYVVARSKVSEVDVGNILGVFGGGGHPYAASATLRDQTRVQVEEKLVSVLYDQVKSRRKAADLMSSPAITVGAEVLCKDAAEILNRYNINALLVTVKKANAENSTGEGVLAGYISRQIIEKTLYHGLGNIPVREYMNTELESAGPDATLTEIQEKIIGNKQRILPVIDDRGIVGVVTRTDLLNTLVQQSKRRERTFPDPYGAPVSARTRNILKFIKERLSKRVFNLLKSIGETADEIGCGAYVAGGFVRDLFLYRPNDDIDIVIEGNGIEFAKTFSRMMGARLHAHEKFGTAVIIFPDGFKIDVASARLEYYQFPAALPVVEMSSIKLDMFRRDFTVNTLAIQLNAKRFGILIDFFSGQKDIKEKVIRVLHNLSFVEDPTRVFRAIRFEQRFGFSIGKVTAGLIENAVKMRFFERLSGRRVFSELRQILEEDNPTPAMVRLQGYNLLSLIHPAIVMDPEKVTLFNAVKKVLSWHDLLFLEEPYLRWAVYFLALIRDCDDLTANEVCQKLEMPTKPMNLILTERLSIHRCLNRMERKTAIPNSELYRLLSPFRVEPILYMMAATSKEPVKRLISNYFTQLRYIKPSIRGKDLRNMGYVPGPVFREILEAVLEAKLNGRLKARSDELEFARSFIR